MIAFIAIFLPPVLKVVLWEKIFYGDHKYIVSILTTNVFDVFIVNYIFKYTGDIVAMITEYSDFAIKYIFLSCAFSMGVPFAVQSWKKIFVLL